MKKSRKYGILSVLTLMFFANTVALAVTKYPSNGIWRYGPSVGFGYSDYFHSSSYHHSTVVNDDNGNSDKDYGGAGEWSNAKYIKVPPIGLSYYYGFD
ncbi:MAG: lactococcin 972 family bacteriocin [Anaerococcus sp.]|nr:lactococcin 972 family bacteriocin [Anaerococcus sp.]